MIRHDADHGSSGAVAIVLVLVIAIVAVLVFAGVTMVHDLTPTELSAGGVDLMMRVSGDDVVAVVVGGERAGSLVSLDVYFHGHEDVRYSFEPVAVMKALQCTGMSKGVEGWQTVIAEGTFANGKTEILGYTRLRFA